MRFTERVLAAFLIIIAIVGRPLLPRAQDIQVGGHDEHIEDFAKSALGELPAAYRTGSLSPGKHPRFTVEHRDGQNVLVDASPEVGNLVYYLTVKPLSSIEESYSFTYSEPSSVVEPILVDSLPGAGNAVQGYVTDLTASGPGNNAAGNESFAYTMLGTLKRTAVIKGRLRTEPYFYKVGHDYRVDIIADPKTHILSTRVYDVSLGPLTFDPTIKAIPKPLHMYPGLLNALGGKIEVHDFSFGAAGNLPVSPHPSRRASDYFDYLGYNAAINGGVTTPSSLAFQKFFPALLIKHVRIPVDGGNFAPSANAVAKYGINVDALTSRQTTIPSLQKFIAGLALPPDSIELWNEPNNSLMGPSYDPNYASNLPIFARQIRTAFPGIRLWGPSFLPDYNGYPSAAVSTSGSLGPFISGWNAHAYTRSSPENVGYGGFFSHACGATQKEDCGWYGAPNWNDNNSASINPNLPGVTTEGAASYGTYPAICGAPQLSLEAQQAYVQRGMFYNFKLGHVRIYPYKFIDDGGCSDGFGTYGILSRLRNADRSTSLITPKPAYTALVYLDHLLNDNGSDINDSIAKPLSYTLRGAGADVQELLLAESDGSYRLVVWSDAQLWDYNANGRNKIGSSVPLVRDDVELQLAKRAITTVYTQTPGDAKWTAGTPHRASLGETILVNQYPLVISIEPNEGKSNAVVLPLNVATPGPVETFVPKQQISGH